MVFEFGVFGDVSADVGEEEGSEVHVFYVGEVGEEVGFGHVGEGSLGG